MLGIILRIAPWLLKAAPLLSLVKSKAKIVVSVLTLVSLLGTYLYIGHLKNKIETLTANSAVYQGQVLQCQEVNRENLVTIDVLTGANESFATALVVSAEERARAAKEAEEREARGAEQLDDTLTEMEGLRNASPTCKELSEIDMGAVCPLVVDSLRKHALGPQE